MADPFTVYHDISEDWENQIELNNFHSLSEFLCDNPIESVIDQEEMKMYGLKSISIKRFYSKTGNILDYYECDARLLAEREVSSLKALKYERLKSPLYYFRIVTLK